MHTTSQHTTPGGRNAMSKSTVTMSPTTSCSDMRYFAYKLGYLSRVNIRNEAQKAEPHLSKLLGHAMLFDNARNYINQHLYDEVESVEIKTGTAPEWKEEDDEEEATFQYVEDIEDDQTSIQEAQIAFSSASLSSNEPSLKRISTSRTLSILHASPIEVQHNHEHDWDNVSNSSTEADDDDDGHWSDSTCEEEDIEATTLHCTISDPYLLKSAAPEYTQHKAEDDDIVLWSQQPHVLSLRQVEDMFVEAFR